jgi:uncharacterized protein YycO
MGVIQPGDFFLAPNFGPKLLDRIESVLVKWGTRAPVAHAGIYVGEVDGVPSIVEAEPEGARLAPLDTHKRDIWSRVNISQEQRDKAVEWAVSKVGTPYGFLDIIAIALCTRRLGLPWDPKNPPAFLKRLRDPKTLICSQLVAMAYQEAGVTLVDGLDPALTSPGDLWRAIGSPAFPTKDMF